MTANGCWTGLGSNLNGQILYQVPVLYDFIGSNPCTIIGSLPIMFFFEMCIFNLL